MQRREGEEIQALGGGVDFKNQLPFRKRKEGSKKPCRDRSAMGAHIYWLPSPWGKRNQGQE